MQYLTWETKRLFPGKYLIAEHVPDHESIVSSAGFHATWVNGPFGMMTAALQGNAPVANIETLQSGPARSRSSDQAQRTARRDRLGRPSKPGRPPRPRAGDRRAT